MRLRKKKGEAKTTQKDCFTSRKITFAHSMQKVDTAKNNQFASHFFPSMLLGRWLDKLSFKAENHLPGAESRRLLITVVERSRLQAYFLHLTFSRTS